MVNASLNWASIVGIVLAVCGGGLYFLRSFKPALARDYDVFFAAIGLLCGGILFFQGWRLDPILQFGQFLLAGTTVFFAYESVRLRGIATDQARRSAFFEDDDIPNIPRNSARNSWDDEYDKFDDPIAPKRRFKPRNLDFEEDDYPVDKYRDRRRPRTIPESAISRGRKPQLNNEFQDRNPNQARRVQVESDSMSRRNNFGDRRNSRNEVKRGSRPLANQNTSRRSNDNRINETSKLEKKQRLKNNLRSQTLTNKVEDASFIQKNSLRSNRKDRNSISDRKTNFQNPKGRYNVRSQNEKPRDNSSRFDD